MRRILATFAFALLVAGCGGSGTSDSSKATTTTASKQPASTSATTSIAETTTTTEPTAPAMRLLSEEELAGALLGVQDMPVGYSQDPPSENPTKTFCDYKPPFDEKVYVTRDFTKGGGMSIELTSLGLRQYADPEQAKAAFDAMATAIESCPGDTFQGTELVYAPMSAPKLGDASVGVRITADGTDLLQFFVLSGPTIIRTGGGGLMNANLDEVTQLLEAQLNAYQSAAAE